MQSTVLITCLFLCSQAAVLHRSEAEAAAVQSSTTSHSAVLKLEPLQGLRLGSQQSDCELEYVVSSPQYAVYLGTAEQGGGLRQSRHCASSKTCTGSFLSDVGTLDLILATTVFVPEDFGSFEVGLRLSGEQVHNLP